MPYRRARRSHFAAGDGDVDGFLACRFITTISFFAERAISTLAFFSSLLRMVMNDAQDIIHCRMIMDDKKRGGRFIFLLSRCAVLSIRSRVSCQCKLLHFRPECHTGYTHAGVISGLVKILWLDELHASALSPACLSLAAISRIKMRSRTPGTPGACTTPLLSLRHATMPPRHTAISALAGPRAFDCRAMRHRQEAPDCLMHAIGKRFLGISPEHYRAPVR